jgi:hypothetical protein
MDEAMSEWTVDGQPGRVRALSRSEYAAALLLGAVVCVLAAAGLSPYPELLGNDQLGPVRWTWEFFKPVVPFGAGAMTCLAAILVMQRRRRDRLSDILPSGPAART